MDWIVRFNMSTQDHHFAMILGAMTLSLSRGPAVVAHLHPEEHVAERVFTLVEIRQDS